MILYHVVYYNPTLSAKQGWRTMRTLLLLDASRLSISLENQLLMLCWGTNRAILGEVSP